VFVALGAATLGAALTGCSSKSNSDTTPTATTPPSTGNATPTVGAVASQSVDANGSAVVAFTVADAETAPASLTVSAASADPTLLPASGIVLGGSGANRTVALTPAEDASGRTAVTLTVTDGGGAKGVNSFVVDVVATPTSVKTFAADVFAKPATDPSVALSGKAFVQDADDPTAFDALLSQSP
jgi:hypothetical protein